MNTEFIRIASIRRIQLAAAMILWIGVVKRNSFAAQVVIGAHPSRYFLWAAMIHVVVIRNSLVSA
jgi:hypothetical protein